MSRNQMPPRRNPTPRKMKPSQLDRIEAKLDALLDILAEDVGDEGVRYDLDGNPLKGGERDETQSLD
ncbi:hypothetical protein EV686_106198 [Paracandidimonas soli]|uniref:Uncharacterized protein n=2 Tax=Paracandidimonas soli TaxID=1917182 RepID=A0A4R3UYB4_9BURK|nr:hypothetical protein EV686_106198 [Paracandidimonas soli]